MAKGNRALKIVTCTLIKGARSEQARGVDAGGLTFATPSVYEHSEGRSSLLLDDLMLTAVEFVCANPVV